MRISVFESRELQATLIALNGFDRTLQAQVRKATKSIGQDQWKDAVRGHTSTRLEVRTLADTARMTVSNQNVTLKSAAVGRPLSKGGARPSDIVHAVEFGAGPSRTAITATSRKGRRYSYTRAANRQFRPSNRTGYAVYPAASMMIPRFAALWTQTVVRTFYETFEGAG